MLKLELVEGMREETNELLLGLAFVRGNQVEQVLAVLVTAKEGIWIKKKNLKRE